MENKQMYFGTVPLFVHYAVSHGKHPYVTQSEFNKATVDKSASQETMLTVQ